MDFLKAQLDKIQQRLGGLNASQKMLTGSLVAIMVMTLLWWGHYASEAEMVPVLPQSFTAADIAKVTRHLEGLRIRTEIAGDRVLVPADRREEAIAALAVADVMPDNFVSGFDEISKQLNPWDPQSKTDALFKEGKQRTLQGVIRRFPGVKDAVVLIEPAGARRIGVANGASAAVHITMKDGGTGDRKLAEAAATLVAGAQQHLAVKNTSVVIGSRRYRITGDQDNGGVSGEIGELVASHERYFEEKVQGLYPYIEGLFVKVAVNVNTISTQTQNKVFDKVTQKERSAKSLNESEPTFVAPAAEPGASANMGASIDQSPRLAAPAGEKTVDETDTQFENFADEKTEVAHKPAGDFTAVSAAVRVPRSYFVKLYKTMNGSTAEPALAALQPVIDAEIDKIRNDVVVTTAIQDAARVVVSTYDDSPGPLLAAATVAPTGSITQTLSGYGKEIAIGALALVSLFMVSMMVRKASPVPVVAAAPAPRETPHLDGTGELAGIAGEGDPMLDGMELDEDAVRAQQMLDQVSTLVGENPDAAATLVKRWLNRT